MFVLALPDLHGDTRSLPLLADELARADVVLLVGDLTTGGPPDRAIQLVTMLRQYTDRIWAICGNWDTPVTAAYLSTEGINLEDAPVTLNHVTFVGIGGALPSAASSPNELPESAFTTRFAALRRPISQAQTAVVVCHQPPFQTRCDRTSLGQHVGSHAVRRGLEQLQPQVCVTGHIHEGIGIDTIGRTTIINPGPLWMGGYATLMIEAADLAVQCHTLPQP